MPFFPDNIEFSPSLLLTLLAGVVAIVASLHVLMTKRDSKSALAWVAFCLLLPFFGPFCYLLFGINRISTAAQETYRVLTETDTDDASDESPGKVIGPMANVGHSITGLGLRSCDDIQILENGEQCYPAMLADIAAAKDRIFFSTFIFLDDETGNIFVKALLDAQNRGVDVRVIVDGLAGLIYRPRIIGKLNRSGLNYKLFNPIKLIPPALHLNLRNHRKILVIDGKSGYAGGQNIGDRHLVERAQNSKRTRDLHFRFSGKIVDELERAFLKDWSHCCGNHQSTCYLPSNKSRAESEIWTRLIPDGPNDDLDKHTELLVGVMSAAKKRIWIMTPYFIPSFDLLGALVAAERRGIDVKIMVPETASPNLAHWAALHNLQYIISRRLPVYTQPAPFMHTKAILIDDYYALVGSANLDPRSLRLNFEIVVEVFSNEFAASLEDYFNRHLDEATQLLQEQLDKIPRWMRVRNAVAWLFSPYL